MGRVIDSGGVFAPRLERKTIQQGRIPFSERLAERYLSPTGVAQTAALIGAVPIPESVSRYFMKKDKPEVEEKAAPLQTPAQQIAAQRVGEPPIARDQGTQLTGTGAPTPTAAEEQRVREAIAPVKRVLDDVVPDFPGDPRAFAEAPAGQASLVPGRMPIPPLHPEGTLETYLIQQRLIDKGLMTPEQIIGGEGRMGPLTTAALQQEEAQRRAPEDLQQVDVPQEMVAEPYIPGTDQPVPAEPTEMQADKPAPQTLQSRFEGMLVQAGEKSFDAGMNFMRVAAKQARTGGDQALVLNSLDLVDIPPRTIGDLLTGAHKDRFRKEIMGLLPKLKEAGVPSALDKARAAKATAEGGLAGERAKTEKTKRDEIRERIRKSKGKGSGGAGSKARKEARNNFRRNANDVRDGLNRARAAARTVIDQHKGRYDALKNELRAAKTLFDTTQKSLNDGAVNVTEKDLEAARSKLGAAEKSLKDFDQNTGYSVKLREDADIRRQITNLNDLKAEVDRRGLKDRHWDTLASLNEESGISLANRQQRARRITEQAEKKAKKKKQEAEAAKVKAEQKTLLDRYKNSSRFEDDFKNNARREGVSKTPLSDIVAIKDRRMGISDEEVMRIARAAGRDYGDPFLYLNEVFFAEDHPKGMSLSTPERMNAPGVPTSVTATTYRDAQHYMGQGYKPLRN